MPEVETDLAIGVALNVVDSRDIVDLTTRVDRLSKMLCDLYTSLAR